MSELAFVNDDRERLACQGLRHSVGQSTGGQAGLQRASQRIAVREIPVQNKGAYL